MNMVVGTSASGLIGAIYAANVSNFNLEWTTFKREKDDLTDFSFMTATTRMGFAKG